MIPIFAHFILCLPFDTRVFFTQHSQITPAPSMQPSKDDAPLHFRSLQGLPVIFKSQSPGSATLVIPFHLGPLFPCSLWPDSPSPRIPGSIFFIWLSLLLLFLNWSSPHLPRLALYCKALAPKLLDPVLFPTPLYLPCPSVWWALYLLGSFIHSFAVC